VTCVNVGECAAEGVVLFGYFEGFGEVCDFCDVFVGARDEDLSVADSDEVERASGGEMCGFDDFYEFAGGVGDFREEFFGEVNGGDAEYGDDDDGEDEFEEHGGGVELGRGCGGGIGFGLEGEGLGGQGGFVSGVFGGREPASTRVARRARAMMTQRGLLFWNFCLYWDRLFIWGVCANGVPGQKSGFLGCCEGCRGRYEGRVAGIRTVVLENRTLRYRGRFVGFNGYGGVERSSVVWGVNSGISHFVI